MSAKQIHDLPLDRIRPSSTNPRTVFDPEELQRLAGTIKVAGVEQPILVRPAGEDGIYEIEFGEMRWRASLLAGLTTIPAMIATGSETPVKSAPRKLRENCCRFELAPLDLAAAVERAIAEGGVTAAAVAQETGLSEGYISKLRALLKLPKDIQESVQRGALPVTSAYQLLKLDGEDAQRQAAVSAVGEGLSREGLARKIRRGQKAARTGRCKMTMPLAPGCSLALIAPELSVPLMVEWLSKLLDKARAAQGSGVTLAAFVGSLRPAKQLRKAGAV